MIKSLIQSKFNYYLSKSDYYQSVISENSFIKTVSSDFTTDKYNHHQTEECILFNNKIDLNSSYTEIVSRLGKPNYELQKSKSNKHTVLFYKRMIGNLRTRFELHLVRDQLIIGFLTFDIFSPTKKVKVINALAQKYAVNIDELELEGMKIIDKNKRYIKLIDSVHLTLAYGIDSQITNNTIYQLANENELAKLSEQKRESLQIANNI